MDTETRRDAAAAGGHTSPPPGRPLRVVHLVYRFQPGGMEFGVLKLANGLDRRAVRTSVCSTVPATDMKRLLAQDVPLFECRRREGNDPRLVIDLVRLFARERPDIVHTHAWGTLCEGLVAARLARVPIVVHGEHGTLQLNALQRRVQRIMWGRADRVLSVSSRLAERMAASTGFPRARIAVIRNGVDLARFGAVPRDEARRTLNLDPGDLVAGTLGRLVPVKDHARLIDTVAALRARGRRVTAVIAGEGPLRAELETRIASLGLDGAVRLLGHRGDPERVLAALDLFVLPSRSEGLSNTILEAMASGLPVVATAVGGNDELVDHGRTGLLVPPDDPAALADAIDRLATSDGTRRAMGAAALARARTDFSLDAMIRSYETIYLDAARGRLRPPGTAA